jgi:hypothetical protein
MQKENKSDFQTVKGSDWLITVWLFNNCQPLKWQSYFLTDANRVHNWVWENTGDQPFEFLVKLATLKIELDKHIKALSQRNILLFQIFDKLSF